MDQSCDCFCHMPGCVVMTGDGEPCCADWWDEMSPIPRASPPYPPGVTELSPNATQGRGSAKME